MLKKISRCNVLWYIAPLQSQKMLLFLMHRTIKLMKPAVIGKLFVASLEGFATVMYTTYINGKQGL